MKIQQNILRTVFSMTVPTLTAALLLASCVKAEMGKSTVKGLKEIKEGSIEVILNVSGEATTKTTISQDDPEGPTYLPVKWKSGDKLYVVGETDKYIGYVELTEGEGTAEGTFIGKLDADHWTTDNQTLHIYYLGDADPAITTEDKFTFDISSQDGSLETIASSGHIAHASISGVNVKPQRLSATMNNMNAIVLYDLTEWTSGVSISGTYNSAELDLVSATFTGTTGDIAIPAENCTAQTYVTIIPDPDPSQAEKSLTFKQGTASTPTKSNKLEAGRFYSDAGNAIKIAKLEDDGSLPGLFSVSPSTKVYFSKGNLRYTVETAKWSFYNRQYDCGAATYAGGHDKEVSLLTWGYNATKSIVPDGKDDDNVSLIEGNLSQSEDWGCTIGDGKTWRTLTTLEWAYLLGTSTERNNKYKLNVNVCGKAGCLVIAPDDFTGTIAASYDEDAWNVAENDGLVCLPRNGVRYGTTMASGYTSTGVYWSSTANGATGCYDMCFTASTLTPSFNEGYRHCGVCVRLVKELATPEKPETLSGLFSVNSTTQVQFSRGNLWTNSSVSPQTWSFEKNQYDSTPYSNGTYDASHVSHFYWTDLNNYGSGKDYSATSATGVDWGKIYCTSHGITPDNTWRTLSGGSGGEWEWLLGPVSSPVPGTNCRRSSKVGDTENARYAEVQIKGIPGLLIFPDEFTWPAAVTKIPAKINTNNSAWTGDASNYTLSDFEKLESAGCVFIPAAGYRSGKGVLNISGNCYYWSTTHKDNSNAYNLYVATTSVNPAISNSRSRAFSVRLVKEVVPPEKPDLLPGLFSVSTSSQVQFSRGNLQATYNSSNSSYTWGFASQQYEYVGDAAGNTTIDSQTDGSKVDLFGWSTAATNYGVNTSSIPATYSGDFKEWSTALVLDYTNYWTTLSESEWSFLVGNTSPRSTSLRKYGVTICGRTNCLVIAPDDFTGTIAASYNAAEWTAAETAGLVCLPSSGYRDASTIGNVGDCGYYWSSTAYDDAKAYRLGFDSGKVDTQYQNRDRGRAVRLVKHAE